MRQNLKDVESAGNSLYWDDYVVSNNTILMSTVISMDDIMIIKFQWKQLIGINNIMIIMVMMLMRMNVVDDEDDDYNDDDDDGHTKKE